MTRALLWLLPGVGVFLLVALVIAPPGLAGRALLLGTAAVVPGVIVLVFAADGRRRRPPDAGDH